MILNFNVSNRIDGLEENTLLVYVTISALLLNTILLY